MAVLGHEPHQRQLESIHCRMTIKETFIITEAKSFSYDYVIELQNVETQELQLPMYISCTDLVRHDMVDIQNGFQLINYRQWWALNSYYHD